MIIEMVKDLGNVYLLNRNKFVKKDVKNRDYKLIQEWIGAGNIVTPQFTNSELLSKAKQDKKKEINDQRDRLVNSLTDLTKNNKKYYFDRSILSRQNMAMAAITLGGNETIEWVTEDNTIVALTNQEVLSICSQICSADEREYKLARKRKDEVEGLTTIKKVRDFDIEKVYGD